jgi:hypothetical protein
LPSSDGRRENRANHADFEGDVHLTSNRPDKDFDGAGVSISLAVVGVVAAGLGLLTMQNAFRPLPKPGVPVVIAHSEAEPTQATWRHAPGARPKPETVSTLPVQEEAAPEIRPHRAAVRHPEISSPVAEAAPAPSPGPAPVSAGAPAKPEVQTLAKADATAEKLCTSPTPPVLSAKALQPAMILRYDTKFKARPLEIAPPPADDTERRLKLSALLANMLDDN